MTPLKPLDQPFLIERDDRGRIAVTGRDRQSFLQGMVTNDVAALGPGDGCYAFFLNATGHVLGDLRVLCTPEYLLLDVEPGQAEFTIETLERYLIMERCRLQNVTGDTAQIFLGGSGVAAHLEALGIADAAQWPEGQNQTLPIGEDEAIIAATCWIPGQGFDIYVPVAEKNQLIERLRVGGISKTLDRATLESLRIEAGVPRFGVDFDQKVLAPETNQHTRAIHYRKGCYIGQEIVARIDARGHTNRTLVGLTLEKQPAEPETPLFMDDKAVGRITSSALSPTLGTPIALGYLRHEHAAPGTRVRANDQTATVAALPFVDTRH